MTIERKEIHHHYLEYVHEIGWVSLLYPVGLFAVSEVYKFQSLFLSVSFVQLLLVCFQSYICVRYDRFSDRLDLWEKLFYVSRALINICIGINMTGAFHYDPSLSFSTVLTAAAYAATIESYGTSFHPNRAFLFFSLFVTGFPPLMEAYARLSINSSSNGIATIGVIYLTSMGLKGINLNRGFKKSVQLKIQNMEAQNRISKVLDAMPAKVTWIDEDLNYLEVNKTMVEMYGLTKSDYVGKKVGFQDSKGASALNKVLTDFKKTDKESIVIEAPLRFKSETDVIHSIQIKKIINEKANREPTTEFIIVAVDLSEHKKMQEELEDEKMRHMQSARLSSIGEMAAGIAHEIKNPLAILQGSVEVLQKEIQLNPIDQGRINNRIFKITENIKRIASIITSMQKLSRDTANSEMDWFAYNDIIEDPLSLSQQRLKKSEIELDVYCDTENFEVFCQAQQIGQVLVNLLNNAHDAIFTQTNKKMKLIYEYTRNGTAKLSLVDNGPGVKDPQKLFNPFYTTKPPGSGTGLGLSLSKKLIEQNRGTLTYHRINDETHFVIEFPAASVRKVARSTKTAA